MTSTLLTTSACPRCRRGVLPEDLSCSLCGEVLRREEKTSLPAPTVATTFAGPYSGGSPSPVSVPWEPATPDQWLGLPTRVAVLLVGIALAPLLTWTPMLRYVGWFLTSLVHEMGHSAMGWIFGCAAYPAIRLDGHAAAVHREFSPALCVLWMAALAGWAWTQRASRARVTLAVVGLAIYAPLAFTSSFREGAFLIAGHLGELAFAAFALHQALDGGFSGTLAERVAHAAVGAYLVGKDLVFSIGLMTSAAARAAYDGNGSFGLENDLIRFARLLRCSLPTAAGFVLLATLAVVVSAAFRTIKPRSD